MAQQSSEHSPREDERLKHETHDMAKGGHFTRDDEWRNPQLSDDDQPPVNYDHDPGPQEGTPEGMTGDDVAERSEIARFLGRSTFPGDTEALLANAVHNHASSWVLDRLRKLPGGRRWENMQEVAEELGIGIEER